MAEIDYIARAEANMRRELEKTQTNIDRAVDHYVKTAQTQAAIIEEIKKMAEVMAAAAVASEKAVGDTPDVAIDRWVRVLATEAKRLARAQKRDESTKALPDPKVIDQEPA